MSALGPWFLLLCAFLQPLWVGGRFTLEPAEASCACGPASCCADGAASCCSTTGAEIGGPELEEACGCCSEESAALTLLSRLASPDAPLAVGHDDPTAPAREGPRACPPSRAEAPESPPPERAS